MMKKKYTVKAHTKRLLIPQYATTDGKGYAITIAVVDKNKVNEYAAERFPNLSSDAGGAMHIYEHFESWIVLPEDASIATVVHECWHCVYRIFKKINAEGLDNETVAYTLGWLCEVVTNFLYSTPGYKKAAAEFLKKKVDTGSSKGVRSNK